MIKSTTDTTDPSDQSTEETAPEGTDPEGTDESTDTESTDDAGADGNEEDVESLPDWAKAKLKSLTKANSEAAKYRVRAREAEEALSKAKTPEEFEAALADFKDKNAKLERQILVSDVAHAHSLPDDLAELLKGGTREELEAHAKVLAKYAPDEDDGDTELSGGLNPGQKAGAYDPVAESRKARRRRR